MKKLFFILVLFAGMAATVAAQTKKIAYRSHSGTNGRYINDEDDNFGLPSSYRQARIDSNARRLARLEKDSIEKAQQKNQKINKKPSSGK